ncbi:MAG: hypothetical protein KDB70_04005 [Mycobacterium sp.]|nr:hypothetical protein [Mycobacterium sp.]
MSSKEAMQGENAVSKKNTDRAEAAAEAAAARITTRADRRFLWLWLIVATALSVAGNVGHAALVASARVAGSLSGDPLFWAAVGWAAAPPVLLMLAVHGLPTLARMTGAEGRDGLLTFVVWGVVAVAFAWSAFGLYEFTVAMGVPAELAWVAPLGIDLSVFGATRGLVVTAPIAARLRAGAELADTTPKRSTAGVAQDRRASVARPAESRTTATTSADTARTAGPRTVAPAVMDRSHGSTVASETDRAARAEAVTAVQGPRVADLPSPSEENRAVARRLIESGRVKQDEDQTAAVLAASDAGLGKRGIENATGVAASTAARIVAAAKELTDHPIEPSRVLAAV